MKINLDYLIRLLEQSNNSSITIGGGRTKLMNYIKAIEVLESKFKYDKTILHRDVDRKQVNSYLKYIINMTPLLNKLNNNSIFDMDISNRLISTVNNPQAVVTFKLGLGKITYNYSRLSNDKTVLTLDSLVRLCSLGSNNSNLIYNNDCNSDLKMLLSNYGSVVAIDFKSNLINLITGLISVGFNILDLAKLQSRLLDDLLDIEDNEKIYAILDIDTMKKSNYKNLIDTSDVLPLRLASKVEDHYSICELDSFIKDNDYINKYIKE